MACCSSALWHFSLWQTLSGAAPWAGALFSSLMKLENSRALPCALPRVARAFLFLSQQITWTFLIWWMSLRGGNQGKVKQRRGVSSQGRVSRQATTMGNWNLILGGSSRKHIEHRPQSSPMGGGARVLIPINPINPSWEPLQGKCSIPLLTLWPAVWTDTQPAYSYKGSPQCSVGIWLRHKEGYGRDTSVDFYPCLNQHSCRLVNHVIEEVKVEFEQQIIWGPISQEPPN